MSAKQINRKREREREREPADERNSPKIVAVIRGNFLLSTSKMSITIRYILVLLVNQFLKTCFQTLLCTMKIRKHAQIIKLLHCEFFLVTVRNAQIYQYR